MLTTQYKGGMNITKSPANLHLGAKSPGGRRCTQIFVGTSEAGCSSGRFIWANSAIHH